MNGYLLIDKPAGWTSHDVVAKVRNILKKEAGHKVKVGHTGTLDPFATGLLVLMVGNYTKKAAEFSKLDKTYEAEITLGSVSSTGDTEGETTKKSDDKPSLDDIDRALEQFTGEIEQTPHKFSAVKIDGQRAYKLAREGKEVNLEPRKITIYSIKNVEYNYPKLKLITEVSSGTYIRSLAEDIGEKLGTGAYLTFLRRIKVGALELKDAAAIESLNSTGVVKTAVICYNFTLNDYE
jgi:tRNA pseudouridine55 synthase